MFHTNLQVPALSLASPAAVYLEVARETLQAVTVIICAVRLKTAALTQTHCVRQTKHQVKNNTCC